MSELSFLLYFISDPFKSPDCQCPILYLYYSSFLSLIQSACFKVLAEDLDSQVNGRITYSVLKGDRSNHFWIDPVTGVLKVNKRLDRELVRMHPEAQYLIYNQ